MFASWPSAQPISGRASAQRGRSGPKAGAAPGAEPGSAPGGAERSRGLVLAEQRERAASTTVPGDEPWPNASVLADVEADIAALTQAAKAKEITVSTLLQLLPDLEAATGRVEVGARAPQQNPSANGLAERRHHRGLPRAPDRTPAGIDLAQPLGGADPSGGKGSAQVRPELDRARLALTRNTQNARLRIRRPRVLTCSRNVLTRQNAGSQLPSSSQRRLECPASGRTPGRAGARRLRCEAAGTGTAPGVTRTPGARPGRF
ncbi:hypothetical protein F6Q10_08115 [Streptomyces vinaceus]|nr:hypothetical protein [Streptomyces vinaceus]